MANLPYKRMKRTSYRNGVVATEETYQGRVLHGPEARTIVDTAGQTEADLIVCGSRGRGHLRSMLLGSVSAGVAAHAPCSVLVARHPSVGSVVLAKRSGQAVDDPIEERS